MTEPTFEAYIRQRMRKLGLNQSGLAAQLGVSRQRLSQIMQPCQVKKLEIPTLVKLARLLAVHPLDLIQRCPDGKDMPQYTLAGNMYAEDHSAFVRDVTIPDGSVFQAGAVFEKTWEIQNLGLQVWERRCLCCADQQISLANAGCSLGLMPMAEQVLIPTTWPGETVQISVTFRTPAQVGTYISYWKMIDEAGQLCFPQMSGVMCLVVVA
jgi:DNA-binding Xre family transcriptional regulator